MPGAKFLFVGDGPWRQRFADLAQAAGLADRFVFTGLVPPAEVGRYVGLMDCLVHLSRREGLPRALPQALAAGRPVVAYDCDGAGEVCRTDETGFLIPPGDHGMLVERLAELAAQPELRRRLGETGRQWVCERFTVARLVQDQHELYLRLAKERGLP